MVKYPGTLVKPELTADLRDGDSQAKSRKTCDCQWMKRVWVWANTRKIIASPFYWRPVEMSVWCDRRNNGMEWTLLLVGGVRMKRASKQEEGEQILRYIGVWYGSQSMCRTSLLVTRVRVEIEQISSQKLNQFVYLFFLFSLSSSSSLSLSLCVLILCRLPHQLTHVYVTAARFQWQNHSAPSNVGPSKVRFAYSRCFLGSSGRLDRSGPRRNWERKNVSGMWLDDGQGEQENEREVDRLVPEIEGRGTVISVPVMMRTTDWPPWNQIRVLNQRGNFGKFALSEVRCSLTSGRYFL